MVVGGGNVVIGCAGCDGAGAASGSRRYISAARRSEKELPARGGRKHHAKEEGTALNLLTNLAGNPDGREYCKRDHSLPGGDGAGEPDESGQKKAGGEGRFWDCD